MLPWTATLFLVAGVGSYAGPQQFSAGFAAALMVSAALSRAAMGLRLKGRGRQGKTAVVQGVNS
jgi:hypothetical protein